MHDLVDAVALEPNPAMTSERVDDSLTWEQLMTHP